MTRNVPNALGSRFNEWLCDNTSQGDTIKTAFAFDFPGIAHLKLNARADRARDLFHWLLKAQDQSNPHLIRQGPSWYRA